jgi:DNA polymerase III subunit alpha
MTYKELKDFCDEKIKEYPQYLDKYKEEIHLARRYYDNKIDLVELLKSKPPSTRYIIPFLLGITNEVSDKEWEYKFVKSGGSSGLDIDLDFDPIGKEKIQQYLISKFGEDRVLHVGTFSRLGPSSAAKDLLRIYKIDFKESNDFTTYLQHDLSWEGNLENLKEKFPRQYEFYTKHKSILDLTPFFVNKIRQGGRHAGGIVILDRPVYERIPVDRISGELVTAFPESAQDQVLDEIGVVKFDILAISILDVIKNTIKMLEGKKLFLIEEDGITKVVEESYLNECKDTILGKDI